MLEIKTLKTPKQNWERNQEYSYKSDALSKPGRVSDKSHKNSSLKSLKYN